ncbi:MAG TPA: polysaccharide biosynthesis C-terminal domain-containing protein [Nitrolancea sp.]|nr:polysaccharide biosynthesis C-terminal domain-containing protein [Nitrolancea sp.]
MSGGVRRLLATPIGVWTLFDQGLVSLGGVATSIILARSLSPSNFGLYVLLFGAMLFLNTVHASFVVYPLSVRGARLDEPALGAMTGTFLFLTLLCAISLAPILIGVSGVFGTIALAPWAIVALLAWEWQETIRRALFAELRHRAAIPGDVVAYLGQAALILGLRETDHLTIRNVFIVMAVTSLVGAALQLTVLRPRRTGQEQSVILAQGALRDSRLVLPANLLGSVIMQALVWTLALVESRAGAADLQALINIVGVANPVMFGVANIVIPLMARDSLHSSVASEGRRVGVVIAQGGAILLPYSLALMIWPRQILSLVYGHASPYVVLSTPLRLLTVAYLLVYVAHVGNATLLGLERTRAVLIVQSLGVVTLLLCGVPFALVWGVTGAALATVVVHAVRVCACGRGAREAFATPAPTSLPLVELI